MSSVRTTGEDEAERRVIANIAEYGWHCVGISAEGQEAGYAFTVGLFHTYRHPELVIFGLRDEAAHGILNLAAEAARTERPLDLAVPSDELIEGYQCCFVEVPKSNYQEYVGFCRWFYKGNGFPLYQIVWPSRSGLYPWHPDASQEFKLAQPVIAPAASAA
jgi:hypothetical protein